MIDGYLNEEHRRYAFKYGLFNPAQERSLFFMTNFWRKRFNRMSWEGKIKRYLERLNSLLNAPVLNELPKKFQEELREPIREEIKIWSSFLVESETSPAEFHRKASQFEENFRRGKVFVNINHL